jgi:hypothetical protein
MTTSLHLILANIYTAVRSGAVFRGALKRMINIFGVKPLMQAIAA